MMPQVTSTPSVHLISRQKRVRDEIKRRLYCCEYINQGDLIALAYKHPNNLGYITVLQRRTLKEIKTFYAHDGPITTLAHLPNAKLLVSGGLDKQLKIWSEQSCFKLSGVYSLDFQIFCIEEIPEENVLVVSGFTSKIVTLNYNIEGDINEYQIDRPNFNFNSLKYLSKDKMLILATLNGRILLYDWKDKKVTKIFNSFSTGWYLDCLGDNIDKKFIIPNQVHSTTQLKNQAFPLDNSSADGQKSEMEILPLIQNNRDSKKGSEPIQEKIYVAESSDLLFKMWKIQNQGEAYTFKCSYYKGEDFLYFEGEKALWKINFPSASITISHLRPILSATN